MARGILALAALTCAANQVAAQTLHERILADEAQDRANEIIRQERALRNMQPSPGDPVPPGRVRRSERGSSESKLKADRVNDIIGRARAAADRGDGPAALRLALEAQPLAQDPKFKVDLANWIRALEADIARAENWRAAEALRLEGNAASDRGSPREALLLYRRALAANPDCLSEDGKKIVAELGARLGLADHIQQTRDTFALTLRPAPVSAALDFATPDTLTVDARNVHSGLPKSVEEAIPHTPAGERVRKGFQAITEHDWLVAKAWFEDALNHEPGDAGLQRLVALAEHTLQKQSASVELAPTDTAEMDRIYDELVRQDVMSSRPPARPPETPMQKLERISDDLLLQDLLKEYGGARKPTRKSETATGPADSAADYADTFMLINDPVTWRKVHPDWWKDIPEMVALYHRPAVHRTAPDGRRVQLPYDDDVRFLFDPELPAATAPSVKAADAGVHN